MLLFNVHTLILLFMKLVNITYRELTVKLNKGKDLVNRMIRKWVYYLTVTHSEAEHLVYV